MAIIKCKDCGSEISSNAKNCPNCGNPVPKKTSWMIWAVLGLFVFIMIGAINNNVNTTTQTQNTLTPKEEALSKLTIEDFDADKGGFGNVLIANFKIKNASKYTVKDIEVVCDSYANSGTKIDTNKRTIYEAIKPNETKKIKHFNMGFLHNQATETGCIINDIQL